MGYCVSSVDGRSAHLISIAVTPDQRKIGIGISLMDTLLGQLFEQGVEELWLEVKTGNKEAIGLYTKLGFVKVSVVPGYYSDGSGALRMRKLLAAKAVH